MKHPASSVSTRSCQEYCVIGWPLGHSLSPLLHNTGFRTLGLAARYQARPVPPEELSSFLALMREQAIAGCSVTIPHKSAVIPFLDAVHERARRIGAVNTLYWEEGKLSGDNTDCLGFLSPLKGLPLAEMRVLLLGCGGAARACLQGLKEAHAKEIFITSGRSTKGTAASGRHRILAEEFAVQPLAWEERHTLEVDLLVNATPLGMQGAHENETPYDFTRARRTPEIAYDIVYVPRTTRFLREAGAMGLTCIPGAEMFFHQGNAQFLRWTGHNLPPAARTALDCALKAQEEGAVR